MEMQTSTALSSPESSSFNLGSNQYEAALKHLLRRSELRLLTADVSFKIHALGGLPFAVPAQNQLIVAPEALVGPHAAVILRHGLELVRLREIVPLARPVCGLLAARTALHYLSFESGLQPDPLLERLEPLMGSLPEFEVLSRFWAILSVLQPGAMTTFDRASFDLLAASWQLAMPAEKLMTFGGDERLRLDPSTGLNKYGCGTRPMSDAAAFGSCTASTISERGYSAAEACRQRLLRAALGGYIEREFSNETHGIRNHVLNHYQVTDIADAVLAASGTDATLLVTLLAYARAPDKKLTSILMSATETGSGVVNAVAGRHFAKSTVFRREVELGASIAGLNKKFPVEIIPLRNAGVRRSRNEINAEIGRQVAAATGNQGRVLLHMIHSSKTGIQAPDLGYAQQLKNIYGAQLEIVVDACQARIGAVQVRRYLESGFTVLLTGSKFFSGPAFSGILLAPQHNNLASHLSHLPHGIEDYSSQLDWVTPPPSASTAFNCGLLLRWAAALAEMDAFAAVAPRQKTLVLNEFRHMVTSHMTGRWRFIVPETISLPQSEDADWDTNPTILAFGLHLPGAPHCLLDSNELAQVHRWLYSDISHSLSGSLAARPCQIGQPVQLDSHQGRSAGVLRIAASARLVSDCVSGKGGGKRANLERIDSDLNDVFHKIALILENLSSLRESLSRNN